MFSFFKLWHPNFFNYFSREMKLEEERIEAEKKRVIRYYLYFRVI